MNFSKRNAKINITTIFIKLKPYNVLLKINVNWNERKYKKLNIYFISASFQGNISHFHLV